MARGVLQRKEIAPQTMLTTTEGENLFQGDQPQLGLVRLHHFQFSRSSSSISSDVLNGF